MRQMVSLSYMGLLGVSAVCAGNTVYAKQGATAVSVDQGRYWIMSYGPLASEAGLQPSRLETRTKEFNMCASVRVS